MKLQSSILFSIALHLVSKNIYSSTGDGNDIGEIVRRYNTEGNFEGVVLVAQHGNAIHTQGVGLANREWQIPHREDTRFRICSITKQFTAVLVMQLVEDGTLALDAPVTDYLTDLHQPISNDVTLRHLLSNTSGLPSLNDAVFWATTDEQLGSPRFVAQHYLGGELLFEPGQRFSYNNADFILLGAVLEYVTGKSYEQLLHEKILSPLRMEQTGILRHEEITKELASGYIRHDTRVLHEPYYHIQNFSSAGAMYSTVGDLILWNTALLTNRLLSERYQDEMFTPSANLGFVALGSWVYPLTLLSGKEINVIERQGNIGGFCALSQLLPESGHSLIFLSNVETQTLFNTYMRRGLPYDVLNALTC